MTFDEWWHARSYVDARSPYLFGEDCWDAAYQEGRIDAASDCAAHEKAAQEAERAKYAGLEEALKALTLEAHCMVVVEGPYLRPLKPKEWFAALAQARAALEGKDQ